jgi:hypothetical protein
MLMSSDVWALGVLLYKLCYYTTPFEEHGTLAIVNAKYTFPQYPVYSPRMQHLIGTSMLSERHGEVLTSSASMLVDHPSRRPSVFEVLKIAHEMSGTRPEVDYVSALLAFESCLLTSLADAFTCVLCHVAPTPSAGRSPVLQPPRLHIAHLHLQLLACHAASSRIYSPASTSWKAHTGAQSECGASTPATTDASTAVRPSAKFGTGTGQALPLQTAGHRRGTLTSGEISSVSWGRAGRLRYAFKERRGCQGRGRLRRFIWCTSARCQGDGGEVWRDRCGALQLGL